MFQEDKIKTTTLQVRITEEEKEVLKQLSRDNNTTISKIVKSALNDY